MLKILAVGATSAIAHATLRNFAKDGAELFLVGRDADKLATVAQDLDVYGATCTETYTLDMTDHTAQVEMFEQAKTALGGVDALLIAHGLLGDHDAATDDYETALHNLDVNFLSVVPLLTIAANHFEAQRNGAIAVISSVAGDRGRGSNYIYGTGMAAKTTFLQGLRNRLHSANVSVLTVKPGFVDTPMTADVPKNALFADPADVGADIYKAMKDGRDVIYTPWFWRYIMWIIRLVPEPIFKRLSL